MSTLSEDLEMLRHLNEFRYKAKELREQSLYALNEIENTLQKGDTPVISSKIDFNLWDSSNDKIETSLLVKIQSHRDISNDDERNNSPREQTKLEDRLTELKFDEELLVPRVKNLEKKANIKIPVLVAARVMQALLNRAKTVFEPVTMYCYYRIIRELYGVAHPNWTVGAARAGFGSTTSAFVTNECIRAIFSFENSLERTFNFFEQTHIFCKNFSNLENMLKKCNLITTKNELKKEDHPISIWVNKTIEVMWLDCTLSTNSRNREMALFCPKDENYNKDVNSLLLPDVEEINFGKTKEYFDSLPDNLEKAVEKLFQNVAEVYAELCKYRKTENPKVVSPIQSQKVNGKYVFNPRKLDELVNDKWESEEAYIRSATAHAFALKVIEDAVVKAHNLRLIIEKNKHSTKNLLKELSDEFYKIKRRVHRVLEPSKQYLKWVLNRELAAPKETFDAGELVFAATSYGAINDWQLDDKLSRACELLIEILPDNGRLPTKRPFHANLSGYRLIPIGCEMIRALANLLQKTKYGFDEKFVSKMLGLFDENSIELNESSADRKLIGWNFEGAPEPDKPSIWVTATSVIALDRITRMLNARINEIVLKHFDVTTCERPHTKMKLHNLIYSDYGLSQWFDDGKRIDDFTALNLQKMRAHIMRANLPKAFYKKGEKNFSAIFYGPPGTGKTTLAESLALSSNVSLLKLSPSDLILQGQELIEGRAHDVFEALAMLTQCVIIFDEFEPVLKNRKKDDILLSDRDKTNWESPINRIDYDTMRMSEAIQRISQRDDPKFRFVLSGMLPKFGKLHDAAENQSFVYYLGTNIFNDIDEAAKRPGRFDKYFPVYKPDPLSRAGLLLYRLSKMDRFSPKTHTKQMQRFIEFIAITAHHDASLLNKLFNTKEDTDSCLSYILSDNLHPNIYRGKILTEKGR